MTWNSGAIEPIQEETFPQAAPHWGPKQIQTLPKRLKGLFYFHFCLDYCVRAKTENQIAEADEKARAGETQRGQLKR